MDQQVGSLDSCQSGCCLVEPDELKASFDSVKLGI